MMGTAKHFMKATSRIQDYLKAGVTNRQIFGAIIDPILKEAPNMIAKILFDVASNPLIEILKELLSYVLVVTWPGLISSCPCSGCCSCKCGFQ